jgi:phage terminase Nu1 subunit (DNA packaging protein)
MVVPVHLNLTKLPPKEIAMKAELHRLLQESEAQCEAEQAMDDAEAETGIMDGFDPYDVYSAWDMTPEDPEDNELFDKEND